MDQNQYEEKVIYEGKWLVFKEIHYQKNGKKLVWEMVARPFPTGGVDVIPIFKQQNKKDQLLLIANFRPPIRKYVLEFPAGLMDNPNVEENALRELKEETGYTATHVFKHFTSSIQTYVDPWKSTEKNYFMMVTIDADLPENQVPKQELEIEENIKVHFVDFDENLIDNVLKLAKEYDYEIQGYLWTYALGLSLKKLLCF